MKVKNLKNEQELLNEREQEFIKKRFRQKLELQKEKTVEETRLLMEESVDIDQHVRKFKNDLFKNQL